MKLSTINQNQTLPVIAAGEVVFIDKGVEDYQSLVNGVKPGIAVVLLDSRRDGVEQITEVLAQNSFTKIHIVSHGSPGCLYLGNSELNLDNLNNYSQQLKDWFAYNQDAEPQVMGSQPETGNQNTPETGNQNTPETGNQNTSETGNQKPLSLSHSLPPSLPPSLLLYGCNVAAGDAGEEFIDKLHQLTAANIAASTTAIGNAQKGGNWQLDLHKGEFLSQLAFSEEATVNYAGVLATTIYVKSDAGGSNNGSDWANAYTDLKTAIDNAVSGDQIWVAQGTYKPTNTTDRSISFELKDGVAIYGGFAGGETSLNQRNWQNNETILSGDIGNPGDNSDNTKSVVKSVGNSSQRISNTAILDGFTVRDGNGDNGAGLYLNSSDVTLSNLNVSDNNARFTGAGLYILSSDATLNNLNISNNIARSNGGGIRNFSSNPTLNNVIISGNSASDGGGIANRNSIPQIRNSILWDNTATNNPETDGGNNYQNSIVKGSGGSANWNSALGTDGGGNLDLDPLFVDAANGDFRLQAASPAIDAGDNSFLPADASDLDGDGDTTEKIPFDLAGNPRTLNATVDMGAYEKFVFAVDEDAAAPTAAVGTLVSDLFEIGIAITAADTTNGSWFYSIDNGSNWNPLGNVSDNNGRLLAADTNTRIYFQPNANYNGTINEAITFRNWDESSGNNGDSADTTINGGGTAFSSDIQTTLVIVNSINDAPSFTDNATLAAVDEGVANPAGETIANLFNSKFQDVDAGASLSGVAVVGNAATNEGKWQYSTDSSTWNDIVGTVNDANAFALSENTKIRFLPGGSFNGTPPSLTVRALDDSYSGGFATTINVTTNGGDSAISASTNTISTTVNSVAGTIYVNSSATGDNNGGSWDNAYTDLQSALANANSGDEIWVAKGIYKPGATSDATFELKDNVAIYGGFAGTEANLNQRDFQNNITILSGDNTSYNVVKFSNTSATTTVNGFIIQQGNSNDDGGGIWNRGNLTLENIVVKNNQAADDGGGIRNDGNLTIINSAVADNVSNGDSQTSGGGGLINTIGATATIINSTFSGNEARFDINTGNGGNGGAIRNDGGLNLINSTLSGNTAASPIGGGGAIANSVGIVTVKNSTITNNTAAGIGAGVSTASGVTVTNSIIAGNVDNKDVAAVSISGNNGSFTSGGNNLIGNGEGTSFTNGANGDIVGDSTNPIDAKLGNLQDNGGLTQTHALLNGSPAVNAGSNSSIAEDTFDIDGNSNTTETLPFEQRGLGFERIIDNTVDIGAYEIVSVVEVSATTADGIYKTGDTVDITVKFAKPVSFNTQDGLPQLTLETGKTDRIATYKSGNNNNSNNNSDTLTFTYLVQAGDESLDLDYISKAALQYSGGTIKDENGREVDLTLPNPGETDSLSDNKNIVIDAKAPTVVNITPSTLEISDSTTTFSLSVEYSEEMDTSVNPVITIGDTQNTITLTGGSWNSDSKTYVATYSVSDVEEEIADIDVKVENAKDKVGNIQDASVSENIFSIDNENPTVVKIAPSIATISDSDSTTTFELTVKYSEEMDVSVNPNITFPTENPDNTISFASGIWESDNKTYVAKYNLTDASEELANIDVKVENAVDKVGNIQTVFTENDVFSIDNQNPTVTLTSTAAATVNSTFNVTAEFSELVNDFDINDVTLNNATISNFTGSRNNYTFDVKPTATGRVTVDINSAVAQDSATNNNTAATQLTREADLTAPTVVKITPLITPSSKTISDSTTTFSLSVEYSEEMDVSVNPDITFPTENLDNTISFASGSWESDNKTYVANYSVTDANEELADIDVKVENAFDKVGNIQDASVSENIFSIDNENPAVTLTSTAPATVNSKFNVTAEFSELVNDFDINDITLTNATASNFVGNFTSYTFDVTPTATGRVTVDISADVATDIPGNNNTAATQLTREADLTIPTVTGISALTPTISDSTKTFTLTVEYSEEMDTGVNPTISLNPNKTIIFDSGSWDSDNKTYVATYSVSDANEELSNIDVTVENALDKVGNTQDALTLPDLFSIDNQNPAVVKITPSTPTIRDSDSTTTFSLTVEYSEEMDVSVTPAITIENTQNTIALTGGSWNSDNKTYVATYSVTDAEEEIADIDVKVENALDKVGNTQDAFTANDIFSIDNQNPTVVNITSSTPTISDSTTTFTLTVEYSEEMDISQNPDITFPTENPNNTISLASGSWNSDNNIYVATYSVTDAEEEIADIDVIVENAKDKVGNIQTAFTQNDVFSIDNKNPDAPSITGFIQDTNTTGDGITGDNTLIINGSAEANSEIEIFLNGSFIGTTNADNFQNWSFDYTNTTLEDNTYTFSAIAKDVAGNASDTSTPFIITVDAVNDAPILDNTGDMTVDAINEDEEDSNNQGTLIKDIISSGGGDKITDINIDALSGIAVTSVDNNNGSWQYSTDGNNWNDFGIVNDTTARLLAADDSTKIRFVPNPDYEGEVNITFRAWDITSGINGNTADTTNNGGNTAFSSQTETAAITVNPVNDKPTLGNNTLTISEGGSVTLSNTDISATDVDNDDTTLSFTVSNVEYGNFEVGGVVATSFTQQQITDGLVKFIHDDSENQPVYDIEVSDDGNLKDSSSVTVTFTNTNDAPKLENNALTISEGGSVTFTSVNLSATDVDNDDTTLIFTISNLQNGNFEVDGVVATSFTQVQITDGLVKFIHDGSENQPSYDIEVSDGEKSSDKSSVTVTFTNTNDAPTLKNEIANLTATQDSAFNFTLPAETFTDSDVGDILTYSATLDDDSQLPNWLTLTDDTFTGTPKSDNLGEINIKVTATDKDGESVSDTFTLEVEKPNIPPVVDDATFSIEENSAENTVVGIVTASDSDDEALQFALAAGNLDLDKDANLAFAINPDTGEITVNDKDDIDFENTPQFNLEVTATDTGGLNDSADITINLTDIAPAKFDVNASQNGIFSFDGGEKTNIKFTLTNIDASIVNEIAVFEVDENGNIDGLAPGSDGFLKAALSKSQVIFSALSNLPNGFATENIQRVLEINSDARLEFLSISNGTIDTALAEIESTGNTNLPIVFSTSDNSQINNFNSEGFTLELESNMQINAALTQENSVKATQLQTQKELIDLRDITGSVAVNVEVYREAAFDNLIGFYKVTDVNGGIDIDGDGIVDINVGDAGYKNAALTNRITGLDLLSTENQTTTTIEGNLESGSILATFMIADGTFDEAINNNAEVYFSFLGANSDKTDHIRLLGDNTFGFEDMVNGGDKDFNDTIIKINYSNG